ncbi:19331_t:CDS:2 [Gigaspora margarita]|uniref:19331_t:CDS:1 n=1 Tax=Gigaspora margarita TaxID=4874 RepID=A0ABN7UYQ4_GIGMA|nr:19331_t:CDS:2 [Gigaspora margarita]
MNDIKLLNLMKLLKTKEEGNPERNSNTVIENHHLTEPVHLPIQSQFVQRRPRKNHNLAQSTIDNFKPTVIRGKHVVHSRHVLPRMLTSPLGNAPESIMKLLTQDSLTTEEPYLKHICSFNFIFSFTSMGASINPELANRAHGIYTYRLQGAIYHQISLLLPDENFIPKFSQIYIYDGSFDAELNRCHTMFSFLDYDILADI